MKELDKVRNYRIEPSDHLWDRLDARLKSDKKDVTTRRYKVWMIAACFTTVLSCGLLTFSYLQSSKSQKFASKSNPKPIVMEELTIDKDQVLYSLDKIISLQEAYQKFGFID